MNLLWKTSFLAFVLISCSTGVPGNGHVVTQERTLGAFTRIQIDGRCTRHVIHADTQRVTVTTDDNTQSLVTTTIEGETLRVKNTKHISNATSIAVDITTRGLQELTINGA